MTETETLLATLRAQKVAIWLEANHVRVRGNVSKAQWRQIAQQHLAIRQLLAGETAARVEAPMAPEAEAVRDEPAVSTVCAEPAPVAAAPAEPELLPRWRWKQCGLYEVMDNGQLVVAHRLGREHAERILSGAISADDAEADEREHHRQRLTEEMFYDLQRQRRGIRPPEPIPFPWS